MAKLLSNAAAEWVQEQMSYGDLRNKKRRGWILEDEGTDGEDGSEGYTEIRVEPQGNDVYRLIAHLAPILVYRNGAPIPMSNDMVPAGAPGDEKYKDWYEVGSTWNVAAAWTEKVVVLKVGAVSPMDPEWAANQVPWASEWKLELMDRRDVAQNVRPGCQLIIGAVVKEGAGDPGRAVLYNDGPWMPDWVTTDEEASAIVQSGGGDPTPVSLTREDHTRGSAAAPYGMMGLYDFQDPDPIPAGSDEDATWPETMSQDQFIIRHWNDSAGRFEVAYINAGSVAKGDGSGEPPGGGGYPDLPGIDSDCQTVDTDLNHLYVWDSCRQQWVKLTVGGQGGNGTDDRYWIKGSDEHDNYGSAIGDARGNMAIDLNGTMLKGTSWNVEEDLYVWNDLFVTGNNVVGGDLTVTGGATLTGTVRTDGVLNVGDPAFAGAQIRPTGDIIGSSLTIAGVPLQLNQITVVTDVDFTNQTVTKKTFTYLGTAPTNVNPQPAPASLPSPKLDWTFYDGPVEKTVELKGNGPYKIRARGDAYRSVSSTEVRTEGGPPNEKSYELSPTIRYHYPVEPIGGTRLKALEKTSTGDSPVRAWWLYSKEVPELVKDEDGWVYYVFKDRPEVATVEYDSKNYSSMTVPMPTERYEEMLMRKAGIGK